LTLRNVKTVLEATNANISLCLFAICYISKKEFILPSKIGWENFWKSRSIQNGEDVRFFFLKKK